MKERRKKMKEQVDIRKNENTLIEDIVIEFKKRMLEWSNPVEYVNNMYGCHPSDDNMEYFKEVFRNGNEKKS